MQKDIESRVKAILFTQFGVPISAIKNTDDVYCEFGADSLDIVELSMQLEDEFKIEIPDEVGFKIKTVQGFIDYLTENAP